MRDINRGRLEALQTALDQGSTLTRTAITAITREVLESEAASSNNNLTRSHETRSAARREPPNVGTGVTAPSADARGAGKPSTTAAPRRASRSYTPAGATRDGERGPRKVPEAREAGEAPQTGPKATFWGEVSRYGRELAATDSVGIRDLVVMTKEHFGLTLCELAAVMGLAHSTLSKYLNKGRCRQAVLAAATELWGDGPQTAQADN